MKQYKFIGIVLILMLSLFSGYSALATDNEAYWTYDNTLLDSSGNGWTLTNNGANYTGSGKINGAYDFDGATDDMKTSGSLGISSAITVSLWVYQDANTGTTNMIAVEDDGSNSNWQLAITNTNSLYFRIYDGASLPTAAHIQNIKGGWHHIVGTYDGSNVKLYLDNSLKTTTAHTGSINTNSEPLTIGNRGDGGTRAFDGRIDEISIWSRALNSTEINYLWDSGTPGPDQQYPYADISLEFINITANNITLVNDTTFNEYPIQFTTEVLNTSTNGNVNQTYYIYNSSDDEIDTSQFATNNVNGSFSLSGLDYGNYSIVFFAKNNETNVTSDLYFFFINITESLGVKNVTLNNETHLTGEVNKLGFNTTDIGNLTIFLESVNANESTAKSKYRIYYHNGSTWGLINANFIIWDAMNGTTNNFGGLDPFSEGQYYYWLETYNDDGVGENSSNYYFTIDTTNPVINENIPTTIYNYELTNVTINVTDANPYTCYIQIDSINVTCASFTSRTFTTNGYKNYTITATDLAGNRVTETGSLLVSPNFYVYFLDADNVSVTNFTINGTQYDNYFVNDIYTYGLGSHSFTFSKLGFNSSTFQLNFTDTSNINTSFSVPGSRIDIIIYDILDYTLINDTNTTIEIIGNSFSQIYTTTNGTLTIESILMQEETYSIIVSNANYETSATSFNFNNQEVIEVASYLTPLEANDTLIADIIIRVVDDYQSPLRTLSVLQYVWDSGQSKYVQSNLKTTDYNGETSFKVFLNTKRYNFCAEYLGVLYCESDLFININTEEVVIEIPISEIDVVDSDAIYDVDFSYSLTNSTYESGGSNYTSITFTYNNLNQDVDEYCLKIYQIINLDRTLVANQCDVSHSAGLSIDIIENTSNSYIAVATIQVGSSIRILYPELPLYATTDVADELTYYGFLKIIILVLVSFVIGIALHKKVHNIAIAHFGLPILFLILAIPQIGGGYISFESFVLVLLTNLFAWSVVTKKDDLQKEKKFTTLNSIIALYMIFIFGMFTMLTEMDDKGILDEYGQLILYGDESKGIDGIDADNSYYNQFAKDTTDNLKLKRAGTNTGAWDLLTGIFLKTLEFVDVFFAIMSNIFSIASNIGLIIGINNALLIKFIKIIDYLAVAFVVYLYFKEAFK